MSWRIWLQGTRGRITLQVSAIAASVATFSCYFAPSTLFIDKYQEFVQSYEKGLPQPVAENVTKLYEQVLRDVKITRPYQKELVSIFTVYGFDLFNAGSLSFKSGAIIGVPVNFSYQTDHDINTNIKVVDKPVDWSSAAGQQLRQSLVLSDAARKFALARELVHVQFPSDWAYSGFSSGAILATYMAARTFNDKLRIRNHPARFIMYGLVGWFMGTLMIALTDMTTVYLEEKDDEEAAGLSAEYAEGGREFYSKLLQRNQALRVLMAGAGEKLYTACGNHEVLLRMRHAPLTDRLRNINAIIEGNQPTVPTS